MYGDSTKNSQDYYLLHFGAVLVVHNYFAHVVDDIVVLLVIPFFIVILLIYIVILRDHSVHKLICLTVAVTRQTIFADLSIVVFHPKENFFVEFLHNPSGLRTNLK